MFIYVVLTGAMTRSRCNPIKLADPVEFLKHCFIRSPSVKDYITIFPYTPRLLNLAKQTPTKISPYAIFGSWVLEGKEGEEKP
jgi:hypothetical protein